MKRKGKYKDSFKPVPKRLRSSRGSAEGEKNTGAQELNKETDDGTSGAHDNEGTIISISSDTVESSVSSGVNSNSSDVKGNATGMSPMWEHFEKKTMADGTGIKAVCKYCG